MKYSTLFVTLLSSTTCNNNNYATASYTNLLRGILPESQYQTSDEQSGIISFVNKNARISCIQPRNKLRVMDIEQACEELGEDDIPYRCDGTDKAELCCTVTNNGREADPFPTVNMGKWGKCTRIEESELGEDQCDPNASNDEIKEQCNCPSYGWADCDVSDWCDAPEGMGCCSCAVPGRPYVDDSGKTLAAEVNVVGEVKLNQEDIPTVDDNNCTESNQNQASLGQKWVRNAIGEDASVASFAAFSIALMTNGAPSDLVEDALKAGLDEVRHASTSFAIASKLLGKEVKPGPLPASNHEFTHDIKKLAMAVAKEGCVDETLSSIELAAEIELLNSVLGDDHTVATKYAGIDKKTLTWIRDELQIIKTEESNHAKLAWRTFDWVCSIDNDACNEIKEQVLNEDMLEKAFQRRFASFDGTSETLAMMKDSWAKLTQM